MVLEQLISPQWLQKKRHAFLLAVLYTLIGLISAKLIVPSYIGIMGVSFTMLLLTPSMLRLLELEENTEVREKKFSLSQLLADHHDLFKVYLYLFLGVFLVFLLVPTVLSQGTVQQWFPAQLQGGQIAPVSTFSNLFITILINNLIVLAVSFLLSLIYGAGALFFLCWQASVWGIVFGFYGMQAIGTADPFVAFTGALIPMLPHLLTETLAYISAAIVGGVVSVAVIREKLFSERFYHVLTDALILLLISTVLVIAAAVLEIHVA